jgi:hypothetical protein
MAKDSPGTTFPKGFRVYTKITRANLLSTVLHKHDFIPRPATFLHLYLAKFDMYTRMGCLSVHRQPRYGCYNETTLDYEEDKIPSP